MVPSGRHTHHFTQPLALSLPFSVSAIMTPQQKRLLRIIDDSVSNFNIHVAALGLKANKSKAIPAAYKKAIREIVLESSATLNHIWELKKTNE